MLCTASLLCKRDTDFSDFDVVWDQLLFEICHLIFVGSANFHQQECLLVGVDITNWD